jgi:hypothetical protein
VEPLLLELVLLVLEPGLELPVELVRELGLEPQVVDQASTPGGRLLCSIPYRRVCRQCQWVRRGKLGRELFRS